jgi:phage terminase large subunit-like protein
MTTTLRVKVHERGPALWPDFIPMVALRQSHSDVGTPIYRTMYQSDKGGLQGEIIWRELFRYGYAPKQSYCFMAIDPATSKQTAKDDTAIVVANVAPDPVNAKPLLFVRQVWAKRSVREREKRDVLRRLWDHYRPIQIAVEEVAYQTSLVELLGDDFPELPIVPVTPDRDKLSRFLALGALYETGRIVHVPSLQSTQFENQLTRLPHGKNDDMADALVYLTVLAGYSSTIVTNERPPAFRSRNPARRR